MIKVFELLETQLLNSLLSGYTISHSNQRRINLPFVLFLSCFSVLWVPAVGQSNKHGVVILFLFS